MSWLFLSISERDVDVADGDGHADLHVLRLGVDIAPVIRLLAPHRCVLRRVQLWQMPIRHPLSGLRPADSACSRIGRPSSSTSTSVSVNVTRPPDDSAGTVNTGGTKLSALRIGAVRTHRVDERRRTAHIHRLSGSAIAAARCSASKQTGQFAACRRACSRGVPALPPWRPVRRRSTPRRALRA